MSFHFLEQHKNIFACPHCEGKIKINNGSLICSKNHTFDISKSKYINFLTRPVNSGYTKEMLSHRTKVMENGFFTPLLAFLAPFVPNPNKASYILDAGSGEGTPLQELTPLLDNYTGVGLDISKEGVTMAAKASKNHLWVVGDLASTPFVSGTFQCVVNILTPANYQEFKRLLSKEGVLIKIIPGGNYLIELREILYKGTPEEEYSGENVVSLFRGAFPDFETKNFTYTMPVSKSLLSSYIAMSPLSWGANPALIEKAENSGISSITADFQVLVGRL